MENKNKKKSTGLLLSILGVISLVLITAGVTYAFFSYAKQGTTENTIRTGTITFVYNEKTSTGLNIQNALPQSDASGMEGNASGFEFTVTSTTPSTATIDYIVTARVDRTQSTIPDSQVKLYLTSTDATADPAGSVVADAGGQGYGSLTGDTAGSIKTFAQLDQIDDSDYSNILAAGNVANAADEKVIYKGQISKSSSAYTRTFHLNMWLLGANPTAAHCSDSNQTTETACLQAAGTCSNTDYSTYSDCTGNGGEWTSSNTWTPASSGDNGLADYSAYEFVLKSAITENSATEYTVVDQEEQANAATQLVKGTEILTSVDYYSKLEAGTIQATNYTRLAAVNQTANKVYTVAQVDAGNAAPSTTGWEASEQYYPLNAQKFVVTVNVYAEGATTYTTPSNG